MSKVLIEDTTLSDIADSIRAKRGEQTTYKPSEMATAIENIPQPSGEITITENGQYDVSDYETAEVNVGGEGTNLAKINVTAEKGEYTHIGEFITKVENLNFNDRKIAKQFFYKCDKMTSVSFANTTSLEDISSMFYKCTELVEVKGLDTSNVYGFNSAFMGCSKLKSASFLNVLRQYANISSIFYDCTSLEDVPVMNLLYTSSAGSAFKNCPNLTTESLNNILQSFKGNYRTTKTLQYIGLTQEQATICTTLSSWTALEAEGWTTGY